LKIIFFELLLKYWQYRDFVKIKILVFLLIMSIISASCKSFTAKLKIKKIFALLQELIYLILG